MVHLRYIERDGVERDGSNGVLYGAEGPARAADFGKPRRGEKHHFRIVVSPEDGGQLDLTAYVRQLMGQVERDLGRRVEWAAANHYNTAHPHAHVVIRGIDRKGRELRLGRGYISNGLRYRAEEIATRELGLRPERDVERLRAREVTRERFTWLDRELERRAANGRLDMRALHAGRIDPPLLVGRLVHLEALGLAERARPGSWTLGDRWKEQLQDLGTREDVLSQIHRAVAGDPARYRIVARGAPLEPDERGEGRMRIGRVAAKGISDEREGGFYAVLETPDGCAYHVALDAREAEKLHPGALVSFGTRPAEAVRSIDRAIAIEDGRSVAPEAHGSAHPHTRRQHALDDMGLAGEPGPDPRRVSPALLRDLEERQRAEPARYRLLVRPETLSLAQQVGHRGPVWLDRLEPDTLAHHGLGAEVRRARERRDDVLRGWGIEPGGPDRSRGLDEVERQAVGKDVAARAGLTFLPKPVDGFRGRVTLAKSPERPDLYAVVSDERRCVVLRATPLLRELTGQAVELTLDPKGAPLVRRARDVDLDR